ncbi:MAG: hypothetical protein WDO18_00190 [Acidobacteriota bacterium]
MANYAQGTSRYRGFEAKLDLALHPNLWLNLGADAVNARLTATKHAAASYPSRSWPPGV